MALIYISEAMSANGQKRTKIYLDDATDKLHLIDDEGVDSVVATALTDIITITANTANVSKTVAAVDANTLTSTTVYGTTASLLGKPDKWITFTSGTYSYGVAGYEMT